MTRWKEVPVVLCLGLFVLFHSSRVDSQIQDRERKLAREPETPPKDASEVQRNWDEIRKNFNSALLDLDSGEPEEKILAKLDILFQKGATVDSYDEPLERVIGSPRGTKLITTYLLDKGADPNGVRADSKPLKIATKYGNQDIIKLLGEYGAKPLDSAEAAQLRLTFAASIGDVKSIRRELSKGADINSRDSLDHTTALIQAVSFGRLEAVKLLLSLRGDPRRSGYVSGITLFATNPFQSRQGSLPIGMCTPLHAATLYGGFPEIIRVLLKAGARVSSTDCYKNLTPLHLAAKFESATAATVLLKEGAKVMAKDSDGKTPLDYAESGPVIKLLKAYGAREAP